MRLAIALMFALLVSGSAAAQQTELKSSTTGSGDATMAQLIAEGFEIRAAVPNGSKIIVFMQKDQSAYACEFVSLTNSRCGTIN